MPNQYTKKKEKDTGGVQTLSQEESTTSSMYGTAEEEDRKINPDTETPCDDDEDKTSKKVTKQTSSKRTIISLSRTKDEYQKAGLEYPRIQADVERESFERQTKGKWTREVLSIIWHKDMQGNEFLDWAERRYGKTYMGRARECRVDHVATYIIPVPVQQVAYNQETDENVLQNTGQVKEQKKVPGNEFDKGDLDELLEDAYPQCEYIVSQEGYLPYNVSKKEMTKVTSFDKLYSKKSNIKEDE